MPIIDDGDLIRGLGFVALYAAYLEEGIDEVLEILLAADPVGDQRILRRSTSQKMEYIRKRVRDIEPLPSELMRFTVTLDGVTELLEQRHQMIHGRVYAIPGEGDIRKPARRGMQDQPATSAELYALANDIFEAIGPLRHASMFSLPHRLNSINAKTAPSDNRMDS